MTTAHAVWHGTTEESEALAEAIAHNCGYSYGLMGVRSGTCAAHEALVGDQKWLDGLVCERRRARQIRLEEFGPQREMRPLPPYRFPHIKQPDVPS